MTAAQKPITGRKFVTFSQGKIAARKFAREQARLRNSLSRGFQKKLLTVFNRTIKKATESLNNQQIPEIGVISQSFKEELTATVKTQVRRVYSTIYEANYKRYQEVSQKAEGDPFDFRRSQDFEVAVASYFFNRQNMMVGITDTTARQILDRIEKLRGEDNTLDQIARQLPKEFAQVNRRRANVIARTETHSAAGYANHDYYSQASDSYGIQMVKQWVATSDARTRQQHSLMNGTKVPMDEDFIMPNGARMGFTGDSKGGAVHVINCRCVTLYHEPEDIVDDVADIPQQQDLDFDDVEVPFHSPISKQEYLEDFVKNTSPKMLAVAAKLKKPKSITQLKDKGGMNKGKIAGFYEPDWGEQFPSQNPIAKKRINAPLGRTFSHEYGHHVDHILGEQEGRTWFTEAKAFKRAFKQDQKHLGLQGGAKNLTNKTNNMRKWLKILYDSDEIGLKFTPKSEAAKSFSDMIDAASNGTLRDRFIGVFGHGGKYYRIGGNKEVEVWAQMFYLHDKPEWPEVKKAFPNITKIFEEKMDEVLDG
tara:strand:- start:675 stop:2279 length:1605 start_codon:yes stop_codon:yes gene_type:complete